MQCLYVLVFVILDSLDFVGDTIQESLRRSGIYIKCEQHYVAANGLCVCDKEHHKNNLMYRSGPSIWFLNTPLCMTMKLYSTTSQE